MSGYVEGGFDNFDRNFSRRGGSFSAFLNQYPKLITIPNVTKNVFPQNVPQFSTRRTQFCKIAEKFSPKKPIFFGPQCLKMLEEIIFFEK